MLDAGDDDVSGCDLGIIVTADEPGVASGGI